MTEKRWWEATDPTPMLRFLRGRASERKCRLIACAVCRDEGRMIQASVFSQAIQLGEQCADGVRDEGAIVESHKAIRSAFHETLTLGDPDNVALALFHASILTNKSSPVEILGGQLPSLWSRLRLAGQELLDWYRLEYRFGIRLPSWKWWVGPPHRCDIIRDIIGNPFRPAAVDPAWRTSTAMQLAQGMYDSRDFAAMPILADALQDAGCSNDDILAHCRGPGPHARGCWVVDLVLGKG